MDRYGITFDLDEEKLTEEESSMYPEKIEKIIFAVGFSQKVNDHFYHTTRYGNLKSVIQVFRVLEGEVPWFLEKASSVHVFELGNPSDVRKIHNPSDDRD